MAPGYRRVSAPMADPEPPPQPVPFPIRIVSDPAPQAADEDAGVTTAQGKRSDYFYESWDKFLAIEPKRAKGTSTAAKKLDEEKQDVASSDGLQVKENASLSWEQAAAECKAKVAAIVDECQRLNQKYRDAIFDLESNPYCLQSLGGRFPKAVDKIDAPPWIKRVEDIFDDPQFFIDGASATDVHQGSGGDCWFLAALMAVSAKKELIENLCVARNEKMGVYGFVFYRDGEWISEVIDDKLFLRVGDDDDLQLVKDWSKDKKEGRFVWHPDEEKLMSQLQRGGEALYFSHCKSNETWLPLIEKAYAKAHGDYYAIEGGFASEAIEDLTGGVGVVINPEDIMDKDRFWREQLSKVNEKYLFGGGSKSNATKGFVGGHAYAVLRTWEEGDLKLLKLKNPWGETEWEGDWSDGSKLWTADMMKKLDHTFGDDGIFWISYKDFLKHFPSINRVRLFNSDWQVSQQWTSVQVPWTVDYLDTKFQFTITKNCPVVIVLSQPDDRYFYGLRGRYLFSLHFRVYKEGEKGRWLVRSMHNSGNETIFTRSVSAEIEDLEPGTYSVVFKITAVRQTGSATAEEAILKYAVERKEKLLHVGRRFDYAQTKGNLKAMEEGIKKRKKSDKKDQQKTSWKKARKLNQQEKERARKRKKRVDDAMREKRKALEEVRRQKAKQKKQRKAEKQETDSTEAQANTSSDEKSDSKGDITPPTDESSAKTEEEVKLSDSTTDSKEAVEKSDESKEAIEESVKPEESSQESPEKSDDAKESSDKSADAAEITKSLSNLQISKTKERTSDPVSPVEEDDDEYESPAEAAEELDDDDFDWDSEMDGPVEDNEEEDMARRCSATGSKNEIFADDPWNAMVVLGLRVYSLNADAKISVVKDEDVED